MFPTNFKCCKDDQLFSVKDHEKDNVCKLSAHLLVSTITKINSNYYAGKARSLADLVFCVSRKTEGGKSKDSKAFTE